MRKLTLLATDIVALYGSLAAVLLVRYGTGRWHDQYAQHIAPFSLLFSVWLLSFYIFNLYEERVLRTGRDFFTRLAQAVVLAGAFSALFFYLIPYFGIAPKLNLFLFIAVFAALGGVARTLANRALAVGTKRPLLIIGVNGESLELARFIADNPQLGWSVRAMVRLGQDALGLESSDGNWQLLDERTDLTAFIRESRVDTVVVSPQAYGNADLVARLYGALAVQADFVSLAGFAERITGTVPLGAISQQWFLENIDEGPSRRAYENAKRVFDIAAAAALGIPTLLLTPFIALAIVLASPGPVLFRQARTGRGGRPFTIIKFRTMRTDAEKHTGAVWASENDPRVTMVGKFLRTTRLDELPQLWNILRGDMSLIGPRAERPEFDARLDAQIPFYMTRYLIKPGLSGWAQINYPYGSSEQDAMRKLEYDLYYLKHRSISLDVTILLKTASISLRRAGR